MIPKILYVAVSLVMSGLLVQAAPVLAESVKKDHLDPLPEPLTLEYALAQVEIPSPKLQMSQAEVDAAIAKLQAADSSNNVRSWVEARLRYIEPPTISTVQDHHDNRLGIFVSKKLYDFGRQDSRLAAARKSVEGQRLLYQDARQTRRIEIMQSYFDVVLADLQFYRYNEEMAVAYVQLDRLRNRKELGQISDVQVLRQDSEYQRVRRLRLQSQNLQRLTRARLAYVLGRPGQLPDTVARPTNLPYLKRQLPDVEDLQPQALQNNRQLQALRVKVAAAEARVKEAQAGDMPTLWGSAEASAYSVERAGYDPWRVALTMEIPLTDGGRTDAKVAEERAEVYKLKAELADLTEQVKQQVLELYLELDALRLQREQMKVQTDYQDLNLDRSRALYELEVTTDLGDAMVRVTATEQEALQTEFNTALAWEKMDVLVGVTSTGTGIKNISNESGKNPGAGQ
jgi:outer membrane protein TolC